MNAIPSPDVPAELLDRVRARLPGRPSTADVAAALLAAGAPLSAPDLLRAAGAVHAAVAGAGPLQPLLDGGDVTDVLVNGPREVFVDRGSGLQRVDVRLGDEAAVRALAVRMAALGGRRLDDACPCVDARLDGGVRLHAVLPPVSPAGTLISLRVAARRGLGLPALVRLGTVPPAWAPVLRAVVRRRASFLVSGGTGSGKTTVLASLLSLSDPADRVVLVEDAGELAPDLPHVVRLEARHGNAEGAGAVGLDELVRQALRMRPDRLVVGECRGPEVRDLLAALNTGHAGGCGTVHANTAADLPARLVALGALAGLAPAATAVQAASAVELVLHLHRHGPRRRLLELAVLRRDGDLLRAEPALVADPADPAAAGATGPAWPALARRLGLDPATPAEAGARDVLGGPGPSGPVAPGSAACGPVVAGSATAPGAVAVGLRDAARGGG